MTQADVERRLEALADRYYAAGDATRKAASYLREYEHLLQHRRAEPLRVLELGVSSGASLLIWRDYLPNATIIGVDIAEPPERIQDQDRVYHIQGSQDDPQILDRAGELARGQFDLIVDDASHIGYLTKRSFAYLFPRWLSPGGTYVIEDFGTGFMPEYPDGAAFTRPPEDDSVPATQVFASHQHGMVGVVKQMIDHMMTELMAGRAPRYDIERMTILTNVAFLQKSLTPSSAPPWPETAEENQPDLADRTGANVDVPERHDAPMSVPEQGTPAPGAQQVDTLGWYERLRRRLSGS